MGRTQTDNRQSLDRIFGIATQLVAPLKEIALGIKIGSLPVLECTAVGLLLAFGINLDLDKWFWGLVQMKAFYPRSDIWFVSYYYFWLLSGFLGWGILQSILRKRLVERLTETFISSGLKTPMGKLPGFLYDRPIDDHTRKLKLTRSNLPVAEFEKAKDRLEGSLQVYIDQIKENRAAGTVDILYSHSPMPTKFSISEIERKGALTLVVGQTRSKEVKVSLKDTPHILVAGQTGGGKSTFLRQAITTLYLNNPNLRFKLIDLKGGLEFQIFENLPRVEVISSLNDAVNYLRGSSLELDKRMKLIRKARCKDIDQLYAKSGDDLLKLGINLKGVNLSKEIIVVDEIAELFLSGGGAKTQEINLARKSLSKVARMGRAVGAHMIVATQRPDARALDPQVKANLTGTLCFQMVNDASSITVLGNGRATDLPPVPGRGIWKAGSHFTEIQTPELKIETAEQLLSSKYLEPEKTEPAAKPEGSKSSRISNLQLRQKKE